MTTQDHLRQMLGELALKVEQGVYGQGDDIDLDAVQQDVDDIMSDMNELVD